MGEMVLVIGEFIFGLFLGFLSVTLFVLLVIGPRNYFRKKVVLGDEVIEVSSYKKTVHSLKDDHERLSIYVSLMIKENPHLVEGVHSKEEFEKWFRDNLLIFARNFSFQTGEAVYVTDVKSVVSKTEEEAIKMSLLQYT